MKILIISDSHSNIDSLNKIWELENDSDYIIYAGDMIDCGFNPKETVRWFMERRERLYCVLGNHDEYTLRFKNQPKKEIFENYSDYTLAFLGDEEIEFLESMPRELTFTIGDTDFYLFHAADEYTGESCYAEKQLSTVNTWKFLCDIFEKKFPNSKAEKRIAVFGHTHQQWVAAAGQNGMIINPGSTAIKFNGEPTGVGDYIVLENGSIRFGHVNYETDHLYAKACLIQNIEQSDMMKKVHKK